MTEVMEPQCFVDTACKAAALDAARDIIDLGSTFGGVVTYPLWWLLNASSDHPETPSVDEPGEGSGSRNWRQDKLLSPGEIEALQEALRKEGMTIHDLKQGVGTDLYKDREGNIYEKPIGGMGPGDPTGYNINDL